jgi:hypothetical protein
VYADGSKALGYVRNSTPPRSDAKISLSSLTGSVKPEFSKVTDANEKHAGASASDAKQIKDEELLDTAKGIKGRAIRRWGELIREIESQQSGDRRSDQGKDELTLVETRTQTTPKFLAKATTPHWQNRQKGVLAVLSVAHLVCVVQMRNRLHF